MAKIHEDYLQNLFVDHPLKAYAADLLCQMICKNFPAINQVNARKVIETTCKKGKINSSKPMTFRNNQYVYFSNKKTISYRILKDNIKSYKPALHRVITKLFVNGGIISENEILRLSGCRKSITCHAVKFDDIINDLRTLDFVKEINYKSINIYHLKNWDQAKTIEELEKYYKAMLVEVTIISLFVSWLKRVNLSDNFAILYRGEKNNYVGVDKNDSIWDIFAFSSSLGLYAAGRNKPAIIVADCCIRTEYNMIDYEGFEERVNNSIFSTKLSKRRVIPVIFSAAINPSVIAKAKASNYLVFDMNSLFGKNAINIASRYNDIKSNISTAEHRDNRTGEIENVLDLIEKANTGDNFGNIKGDLFEYLMRPIFERIYPGCRLTHRILLTDGDKKYEIDYLIDTEKEYIFVELKGFDNQSIIPLGKYDSADDKYESNTIRWFLNRTFIKFKEEYSKVPKKCVKFSYITTAKFDDKALKVLSSKNQSKEKPDNMDCFYDGESLLRLLKTLCLSNEFRIVRQYYFNNRITAN